MRILIADDHGMMREGLRSLVDKHDGMEVVGQASNGVEVVELAKKLAPDVVVMDITMPKIDGVEATSRIIKENPEIKVIGFSMHSNKSFISGMLKAGAMGYILKSDLFDEMFKALNTVISGQYYLSPKITNFLVGTLVDGISDKKSSFSGNALTDRERQIVKLLTEGLTIKQIAMQLNISDKTADANRRKIMDKLDISNLADLTKYAIRQGLTTIEF